MVSNNVMNEQIQQTKKLFLAKLYSKTHMLYKLANPITM